VNASVILTETNVVLVTVHDDKVVVIEFLTI